MTTQKELREARAIAAGITAAERARMRVESLGKDELLEMALDVFDSCQSYQVQQDGGSWPQPQHGNALKAIELMGKLLGYLGDGRNMSFEQLKNELDRLGYKLEPKSKLKAAG